MAWPTEQVPTDNINELTDNVEDGLEDLVLLATTVNTITMSRGMPDGVAPLDANGLLSMDLLDADAVMNLILTADNDGLDADMLDGLHAASFLLADGTRAISATRTALPLGFQIKVTGDLTNTAQTVLSLVNDTTGTPAAGLGAGIRFYVRAGSTTQPAAGVFARWTDVASGSKDAALTIELETADALVERFRFEDTRLEYTLAGAAPSGNPAAGKAWTYFTASGMFYELPGGTVVGPLTAGSNVVDHDSLTNRGNDAAHTQFLLVSGARSLTGPLLLDDNPIRFTQVADIDVPLPPSGSWHYYVKSDGNLYKKDSNGVVTAAGGTGGSSDHNVLINRNAADAHSQYALLQPSTMTSLTFNPAQADCDFRMAGETATHLIFADASTDSVGINASAPTSARMHIEGGSKVGLYVASDVQGISAVTTGGGNAIAIQGLANADAIAISAVRTVAATSGSYACLAVSDTVAGTTADALLVQSVGTGDLLRCKYGSDSVLRVRTTGLYVNDGSNATFDFTVKGDTIAQLLFVDVGSDVVCVGGASTNARLNVIGGAGSGGIYAESTAGGLAAITANGSDTLAWGMSATASSGIAVRGSATTGYAGYLVRTQAGAASTPAVYMAALNVTDAQTLLLLSHAGTGRLTQFGTTANATTWALENDGSQRMLILGADAATPAAGLVSFYAKSNGLYCRLPAGTVIGPFSTGGSGVTDHGALDAPSLLDDDHTQYLPVAFSSSVRSGGATAATVAFTDNTWTTGLTVSRANADTTASATGLTLSHNTSGTAAAGFGVDLRMKLEDGAGNLDDAALIQAIWDSATSGAEYAHVAIQTRANATLATQFRLKDGHIEFAQRSADPSDPASGYWSLYFKSGGLYAKNGSTVTGPFATGSGTPGGSNTYLQFNDSSAFGGVAALTFVKTTNAEVLALTGRLTLTPTGSRVPLRITGHVASGVHWLMESVVNGGAFSSLIGTRDNASTQETVISTLTSTALRFVSGADYANVFTTIDAATGELRLYKSPGSAVYLGLKPSSSQSSALTYTLPAAAPAANGYVLSSTTGGVTSWIPASGIGGSPVQHDTVRFDGSAWVPSSVMTNDGSATVTVISTVRVKGSGTGAGYLDIVTLDVVVTAGSFTGSTFNVGSIFSTPSILKSITARVTTAIGGATSWDLGVTGLTQAYGAALTTSTGAKPSKCKVQEVDSSTNIVFTANGANFNGTGVVHLAVMIEVPNAPTS